MEANNKFIQYCSFINSSGYSSAAQSYLLALNKSGNYNIKLHIFGGKSRRAAISDNMYGLFMKMKQTKREENGVLIYHCIPTIQRRYKEREKFRKTIGFSTFETINPPNNWIEILNKNDAVIAPSMFNYNSFAHSKLNKPLYYIPHCLDFNVYNKDVVPLQKFDKFTFLFFGTWKERKGKKVLIEAWLREFTDKDNVQLVIKTDKTQKAIEDVKKIQKQLGITKGFAPILFENKVFDEVELARFIKSFDCFVLPTAGEGFCIPGLQCMALGVPVIITNFSGCLDYANEETATMIEPEGFILHKDMDRIPQFRNKKWAFVSVKKTRETMRYVVKNKKKVRNKSENAYNYVREKFNYNRIENCFREMLSDLE
jgi:glycosyltransferase involved in cell wall biosynthesis